MIRGAIATRVIAISTKVQRSFLSERQVYMGLAILLVVVYHLVCRFHLHGFGVGHILGMGYVGVDIFLFFSGLGLCFSCTKNSLSQFYRHRFLRIYPLYLVLALVCSITFLLAGGHLTILGWLCNITTLSYYHIGGCFVDWYLSVLFLFYLFFPLVFRNATKGGIIALCLISEIVVLLIPMHWTYDCAVSRIGIFLLGILYYRNIHNAPFMLKSIVVALLLYVVFATAAHIMHITLSTFLSKSFFIPLFMFVCGILFCQAWTEKIKHILSFLGKHTLEIYVANVITWNVGGLLPANIYTPWTDLLFTAAFSLLLYYINRQSLAILKKLHIS